MKKVIIVTGGSEGLGKEIAKKLSPNNQVVVLALNEDKLRAAASEIGCDYLVCNVSDHQQIEAATKKILAKYQRIDALINNAGIWIEGELETNDPESIKRVLETNTLGTILFSRAVIPAMKKQGQGMIINIVSQAGLRPKEQRTVYSASKYAITGFTDSLNLELAKYNIGVAGVYPYKMKTQMFEKVGINKDMTDALDPGEVAKTVEFILSFDPPTLVTHIEIKNNGYKNKV